MEDLATKLDEWDPMEEDFLDPSSDFSEGLGNGQLKKIRIQVRNIPRMLSNKGLENLFSRFGKIDLQYRSKDLYGDQCIAYIDFFSQMAANAAIKDVNNEPPLYLKVAFAKPRRNEVSVCETTNVSEEKVHEEPCIINKKENNIFEGPGPESFKKKMFQTHSPNEDGLDESFEPGFSNPFLGFKKRETKILLSLSEFHCFENSIHSKSVQSSDELSKVQPSIKTVHLGTLKFTRRTVQEPLKSLSSVNSSVNETNYKMYLTPPEEVSVLRHLSEGDKCIFKIGKIERANSFTGLLMNTIKNKKQRLVKRFEKILQKNFLEESAQNKIDSNYNLGSHVAVFLESLNVWARGIICSLSNIARIILIDYGRVITATQQNLRPLDPTFLELPRFGVKFDVSTISNEEYFEKFLKNDLNVTVFVKKIVSKDLAECCITSASEDVLICECEVSNWWPTIEEIGLKAIVLEPGSQVKITQVYSERILFVMPVTNEIFKIQSGIAKLVMSSHPINRIPRYGELVACEWSVDNQFYRAQIFEQYPNDEFHVYFVDKGTSEVQKIGKVFHLGVDLSTIPAQAVKICLEGIKQSTLPNINAFNFLNLLCSKGDPLSIYFEDLSKVTLVNSHGVKLNDILNRDSKETTESITFLNLELKSQVLLTYVNHFESKLVMINGENVLVRYIFSDFQHQINQYCRSLKTNGYYPREEEVCFVEHLDPICGKSNWCRALVICNKTLGSSIVFCIDTGAVGNVAHRFIRKMSPQFLTIPAAAIFTHIQDSSIQLDSFETYRCQVISKNPDSSFNIEIV